MKRVLALFIAATAAGAHAEPPKVEVSQPVEKLVTAVFDGNIPSLLPKATEKLVSENIEVNKLMKTDFPAGTAYGAVAAKRLNVPYSKIRELFEKESLYNRVAAVPTLRNIEKKSESGKGLNQTLHIKTDIKVPVISDYHTEVAVTFHEDPKGRGLLEWKQESDYGQLDYNQGAVIAEPDGQATNIYVIGIHIIKREHRVPWLGRGTASAFAREHYSNFLTSLEKSLR